MIYTSYFAHAKTIKGDPILVAISATIPEGFECYCMKELAPSYNTLMDFKRDQDWDKYVTRYREETLSKLTPTKVITRLEQLTGCTGNGRDIILLCWEKDSSRCHRSLVSSFLRDAGIKCMEYPG